MNHIDRRLSVIHLPSSALLALGALLGTACGGAGPQMRSGELYAGRVGSSPSIECLPDPDIAEDAFTEHMRRGMELATESFSVQEPPGPASRAALDLQDWSSGPLRAYLESKTNAIEAARAELDLAAEENHRQRIMGGAIVGLMYEDVARVLAAIPAPNDLDDEPEIMAIYEQVIRSQTRPFLETSRRAYHACAANASEPATMHHWSHFCRGREDGLPEGDQVESGATEVEVLPDE